MNFPHQKFFWILFSLFSRVQFNACNYGDLLQFPHTRFAFGQHFDSSWRWKLMKLIQFVNRLIYKLLQFIENWEHVFRSATLKTLTNYNVHDTENYEWSFSVWHWFASFVFAGLRNEKWSVTSVCKFVFNANLHKSLNWQLQTDWEHKTQSIGESKIVSIIALLPALLQWSALAALKLWSKILCNFAIQSKFEVCANSGTWNFDIIYCS